MLLRLQETRDRRRGAAFTLLELIVVVIVLAVLAGIGVVGYSAIVNQVRRDQAKSLLSAVTASEQSWYHSRGSFVSFNGTTTTAATTLGDTDTENLLTRIAPGTSALPATYDTANTIPSAPGQISIGVSGRQGWQGLALTTVDSDHDCIGQVDWPAGSGLTGFGPAPVTLPGGCTAANLLTAQGQGATSTSSKPNAPTNVALTPGPGRIVISWSAPATSASGTNAATSYLISYTNGTTVATISAADTSYTDSGQSTGASSLSTSKSYGYTVTAVNASGSSAAVAGLPATVTPLSPTSVLPDSPVGFAASWVNNAVQLSWTANSNADGYQIWRNGTNLVCLGGSDCPVANPQPYTQPQYTDQSAALDATYTYQLRALNPVGPSGWTSLSVTTPPGAPTAVTAVALSGFGNPACASAACATITWTAPNPPAAPASAAAILGYHVYRCPDPTCVPGSGSGSPATLVGSLSANAPPSFTDTSLAGGTGYAWKVVAYDDPHSVGTYASAAATATTVPEAPVVTSTSPNSGQVVLSWAAPASGTPISGYKVYRLDANGNPILIGTPTATTFTDSGADLPAGVLNGFSTYSYIVAAVTGGLTGKPSATVTAATGAGAIQNISWSATTTSVTLTWQRSAGVSYTVTRLGGGPTGTTTLGSYTDSGLTPGANYSYTLTATGTSGSGQTGTFTSNPVATTTVAAPTAVTVAMSGTTAQLSYPTPGTGLTYAVWDQAAGGAASQVYASTPYTSATITGLNPGTSYSFWVQVINAGGTSAPSPAVTASTVPTAVTLSAAETTGQITLSWTASTVATGYDVYRNGTYVATVPAGTLGYVDSGISGGVIYTYVIQAKDGAGSTPSNSVPVSAPPGPPTGLTATAGSSTVALSWLSQGADAFQVLRCTGASCTPTSAVTVVTPGTAGSFTDTGLTSLQTYTYAITAGRSNGAGGYTWSAPSSPASATTTLAAPTGLTVTAVTATTVALSWTSGAGPTGFTVSRGGATIATISSGSTTTFTDTGLTPGSSYTYTVAATSNGGQSSPSNQVTATTVLAPPTGLTVTASTTTTVTLTWTASTAATGYQVSGCTGSGCTPAVVGSTSGNAATSFTLTGLTANSPYTLTVTAVTAATSSAASTAVTGWTVPVAPVAPTVTGVTASSVSLAWPAVPNALSYTVYRDGSVLATVSAPTTSYTDSTAAAAGSSHAYTYTVTNPGGTSAISSATSATLPPLAPTVTATGGYEQVLLSWSTVASATSYQVYRCTVTAGNTSCDPTVGTLIATTTSATSLTDSGASADNTTYFYAVRAIGPGGTGAFGTTSALTRPAVPAAPAASGTTTTGLTLTWPAVTGATSYQVWQNGSAVVATVSGTTATVTGLTPGSSYTFAVTAGNASGYSPLSATVTVATLPPAITNLAVTATTSTTIAVSWTAATGAAVTGYQLSLSGTVVATISPGTTYTFTGLTPVTQYTLSVAALTNSGAGAPTSVVASTRPTSVLNLTATPGPGLGVITLSWSAVSGGGSYTVTRDGGAASAGCTATTATSCTDTGLPNGTSHTYTVHVTVGTNSSLESAPVTATTLATPPTSVTATAAGTTVTISWTAPSGQSVTGYTVYRCTEPACSSTSSLGTATGTTFTDSTAAVDTTYGYTVTAMTAGGGQSAPSALATATTIPAAITGLSATPNGTTVILAWTADPQASSYNVYRCAGSCTPTSGQLLATAVGASYTDTATTAGSTYSYTVTAVDAAGESPMSGTVSATVAPPVPTGLYAYAQDATDIGVSWTGAAGATSYNIQFSTDPSFSSGVSNTSTTGTSVTLGALTPNTTYYFEVRACNSNGSNCSAYSSATNTTTPAAVPNAPTGLYVSESDSTQVNYTLYWSNGGGNVSGYYVYQTNVAGGSYSLVSTTGSTAVSFSKAPAYANLYFYVCAYNSYGQTCSGAISYHPGNNATVISVSASSKTATLKFPNAVDSGAGYAYATGFAEYYEQCITSGCNAVSTHPYTGSTTLGSGDHSGGVAINIGNVASTHGQLCVKIQDVYNGSSFAQTNNADSGTSCLSY